MVIYQMAKEGKHKEVETLIEAFTLPHIINNRSRLIVNFMLSFAITGYIEGGFEEKAFEIMTSIYNNEEVSPELKELMGAW